MQAQSDLVECLAMIGPLKDENQRLCVPDPVMHLPALQVPEEPPMEHGVFSGLAVYSHVPVAGLHDPAPSWHGLLVAHVTPAHLPATWQQ